MKLLRIKLAQNKGTRDTREGYVNEMIKFWVSSETREALKSRRLSWDLIDEFTETVCAL